MSFNIALSGLAAAQKDIDTTANNIANVNTTGFKESRAEFADVYAASVFSSNKTKVGDGVTTSKVAQQFSQGSLKFTNNSLDLAITGDGFFAVAPEIGNRDYSYTRAGAFKLDKNNFISDNNGGFLQGFPVNPATGETTSVSLSTTSPIQIPNTAGAPRATQNVFLTMNLDSRQQPKAIPLPAFDATNSATYNNQTSTTIYDSLGEPHILSIYFRRTDPVTDNDWEVYAVLDDNTGTPFTLPAATPVLDFDLNGNPTTTPMPSLVMPKATLDGLLANGAQFTTDVSINFTDPAGTKNPTQYSSKFELGSLDGDGTTVGRLTSVDIDASGKVMASYSNGDQTYLAQVAMVKFANPQGLTQSGNTSWRQSLMSGEALAGEANSGTFGAINSSALESSNVNLTNELVDLIAAQRNFQANSRALEVNSTLQNTVLQIR
ncbi:flagellar hook protein FlgE [Rheinheimera mesophila]|uniref:Flagellar hook protein FlgE n=1 Tax=Rheinheimera mesophila TaxID=1547515 RepID=A0A3P3QPR9_9GAMM|nr:flagellar hook protein FlgE [Rheinheimera mesophila]KKL02413.1 flagellar hook protein FlgE [Rheinheimera mesophila]RRJ23231.1 flagellar hook protein FlgE [Rheinheimera mesophila]